MKHWMWMITMTPTKTLIAGLAEDLVSHLNREKKPRHDLFGNANLEEIRGRRNLLGGLVAPNNEEMKDIFGRLVVEGILLEGLGRVSFVWRRCLARRSLLVKNSD